MWINQQVSTSNTLVYVSKVWYSNAVCCPAHVPLMITYIMVSKSPSRNIMTTIIHYHWSLLLFIIIIITIFYQHWFHYRHAISAILVLFLQGKTIQLKVNNDLSLLSLFYRNPTFWSYSLICTGHSTQGSWFRFHSSII